MEKYDAIIVGGGSIDLAIAYRLSATLSQAKVAVVENTEGFSASRAAGAMLGCFGEVTKYTFGHPAHQEKFDLMYASHKIWPSRLYLTSIKAKLHFPVKKKILC